MEIRFWIPENLSAWRYCLRHPRSFAIGLYGFNRWRKEHEAMLAARAESYAKDAKIEQLTNRLATVGKELSALKRQQKGK